MNTDTNKFVLYTDGGWKDGVGAYAFFLTKNGEPLASDSGKGLSTNNQCEYYALINGLTIASRYTDDFLCVSDSQLMINQVTGKWAVNDKALQYLFKQVKVLERAFTNINYEWRERCDPWISKCDKMCDEAIKKELIT